MRWKSEFTKWLEWRRSILSTGKESELADILGISQPSISRLLNGEKKPKPQDVIAIAYTLKEEDRLGDLFKMCGYEHQYDLLMQRRKTLSAYDNNPAVFCKDGEWPYDWWGCYRKRSESM